MAPKQRSQSPKPPVGSAQSPKPRSQSPKPTDNLSDKIANVTGVNNTNAGDPPSIPKQSESHQQQHKRRKFFKIDIPPIPEDLYKAISDQIREEQSLQFLQHEQKLKQLREKFTDQQAKAEQARAWVEELEQKNEKLVKDIRTKREDEYKRKVAELEEQMTAKYKAELEKLEAQWKKELEQECKEISEKRSVERRKQANEEEAKRQAAEDEEEALGRQRQEKLDKEESSPKSELLAQEIEELKESIEKANRNKAEIIWLLKQIIKAEEKQKAGFTQKPVASIATSKQA